MEFLVIPLIVALAMLAWHKQTQATFTDFRLFIAGHLLVSSMRFLQEQIDENLRLKQELRQLKRKHGGA